MTWDTLFHRGQDEFRRVNGKFPKYLYAGDEARKLYGDWFHDVKSENTSYAGVIVVWVRRKVYFKFHL